MWCGERPGHVPGLSSFRGHPACELPDGETARGCAGPPQISEGRWHTTLRSGRTSAGAPGGWGRTLPGRSSTTMTSRCAAHTDPGRFWTRTSSGSGSWRLNAPPGGSGKGSSTRGKREVFCSGGARGSGRLAGGDGSAPAGCGRPSHGRPNSARVVTDTKGNTAVRVAFRRPTPVLVAAMVTAVAARLAGWRGVNGIRMRRGPGGKRIGSLAPRGRRAGVGVANGTGESRASRPRRDLAIVESNRRRVPRSDLAGYVKQPESNGGPDRERGTATPRCVGVSGHAPSEARASSGTAGRLEPCRSQRPFPWRAFPAAPHVERMDRLPRASRFAALPGKDCVWTSSKP